MTSCHSKCPSKHLSPKVLFKGGKVNKLRILSNRLDISLNSTELKLSTTEGSNWTLDSGQNTAKPAGLS